MLNEATKDCVLFEIKRLYEMVRYCEIDDIYQPEDKKKRIAEMWEQECNRMVIMVENIIRNHRKMWEQEIATKKPELKVVDPIQLETKKQKEKKESKRKC